jgi:NAD(P)H-flavin reductase
MLGVCTGHPNYVDECAPPSHKVGQSGSSSGVVIAYSGTTLTLSASGFRGFMLTTDKQLPISSAPTGTTVSSICGGSAGTWSHTKSTTRSSLSATMSCANHPGEKVQVTAYIVYTYESQYALAKSVITCPGSSALTTTTVPGGSSSNALVTTRVPTPSQTTRVVPTASPSTLIPTPTLTTVAPSNLSVLNGWVGLGWVPSVADPMSFLAKASSSPGSSLISISFDNAGLALGWMGIAFGESDYYMSGGKKTVILSLSNGACTVGFYTLESKNVRLVLGGDPWGLSPVCSVASGIATLEFTIGGDSSIPIPGGGTTLYAIFAGRRGSGLGDHGPNWDYRKVDFGAPMNAAVGGAQPTGESSEYYLIHGILSILNFSLVMPCAAFFVLFDKAKYLGAHKFVGLFSVVLLIAGWLLVSSEHEPRSFSDQAEDHGSLGSIASGIATGVMALGVVLWFIRLPGTMKKWVRYAHGIVGVGLAFFGPYVVWTGWLRLVPIQPPVGALDSTPVIWMIVSIILGGLYLIISAWRRRAVQSTNLITAEDLSDMIRSGRKILIFNTNAVIEIPPGWTHPGGNRVIDSFIGRDITDVMKGLDPTARSVSHSSAAFQIMRGMQIGLLVGSGYAPPVMVEYSNDTTAVCPIDAIERVNHFSSECAVLLYTIRLAKNVHPLIVLGTKVFITDGNDTRPYTVFSVQSFESGERQIQLAIKIYPTGRLTSKLALLQSGSTLNISDPIAPPIIPGNPSRILMLAGGTGVTPMFSCIVHCARIPNGGVLLWWLRDARDLFLVAELENLAKLANVRIVVYFTQPEHEHHMPVLAGQRAEFTRRTKTGHLNTGHIRDAIGNMLNDTTVVISGPNAFASAARAAVYTLGIPANNVLALD